MADDLLSNLQPDNNSLTIDSWSEDGVKTPFTLESIDKGPAEEMELIQNQPASNWDTFKNSAKLMYEDTTFGVLQRREDIARARRTKDSLGRSIDNPMLTKDEANKKYGQYGLSFTKDIRLNEAEIIAAKKIRENALRQRIAQSEGGFLSGASSLLGSFAGAMLDPINIATAFIPVTKVIPALKGLEAAGFWGRTAVRGLDGIIMNSLVEPLPVWMATVDKRDYTMADSLFNVVAGGVFGAGIGAFADGVRLLGKGEKFNANMSAAIDYANNNGLDNIVDFQKKNPAITSLNQDDLINLTNDKLRVLQEGKNTVVSLAEDGILSNIRGYGKSLAEAKTSLRKQLGALLDNDSIYYGYRLDDGLDSLFTVLKASNIANSLDWMGKWVDDIQIKADKAGMSLEEYLAVKTDNFTNFSNLVKTAQRVQKKQLKYGELTGDALDDLIESDANSLVAFSELKDRISKSKRASVSYQEFIGDLREKTSKQNLAYDNFISDANAIAANKLNLERAQKQLDMNEFIPDREILTNEINDLSTRINNQEIALSKFLNENDIDAWKYDSDAVDLLESIRAKLEEDPRTFDDVKEQLYKQEMDESGKTWDTSDSVLENMTSGEAAIADDAKIADLQGEIDIAIGDIKVAMETGNFTPEELSVLGLNKEGQSVEMRRADKRIEAMEQFSEAADNYAACRRTEVL